MKVRNPFGSKYSPLELPDNAFVVSMKTSEPIADPEAAIEEALKNPIGSDSLSAIAHQKICRNPYASAVIVVSDNTRPVPYKGRCGILMPVVDILMSEGYRPEAITVLIATGMHRPMTDDEINEMLDERIFSLGIRVLNHQPKKHERLRYMGTTSRGTRAMIDTVYADADLKILTGLVESHFMAGASGGRKAICPGVIGEESTYIFHGPELMDADRSADLIIAGNPVHEESLAVAHLAGADFIINVTLDHSFRITGVFAGDLEAAHLKAVDKLRESVAVQVPYEADIVITHGGFVGINHYQCAKCAVASLGALKKDGYLISIADLTDCGHKIGSVNYRVASALLRLLGNEGFSKLIKSPDWTFLPEQWQVQQWAKVFRKIPQENFYFYAPQAEDSWFDIISGVNAGKFIDSAVSTADSMTVAIRKSIEDIARKSNRKAEDMKIIYLADGPYEIPFCTV